MLLIRIINFFKGYKIFTIEGPFCERFLNICSYRGIYLWNIKRLGDEKMKMCVSLSGWKQFDDIAARTNCTYHLVKEIGLPLYMRTYKKRTGFAIGLGIFCILIWISSFFIWGIEFQADENIDISQAAQILSQSDIKLGKCKISLDKKTAAADLMNGIDNLAWAGITISGSKAIITLKARIESPEILDTSIPCNIVAKKAGIINSVITKLGNQLVNQGQAVSKGQLLVSGSVENSLGTRLLHANSEIWATTWLEAGIAIPQIKQEIIYTKKQKTYYAIKFFNWEFPLHFQKNLNFTEYENENKEFQAKLSKNLLLPIYLKYDKYKEIEYKMVEIPQAEGLEIALNRGRERLQKELGDGRLISENIDLIPIETGETVAKITWECLENIGEQTPIITN